MTEQERKLMELVGSQEDMYGQTVERKIRAKYSLNDELAIQRQRDEKPEAFQKYYAFVEECKNKAHKEIYGE